MPADETELFIALVAAVGTDVGMVSTEFQTGLTAFGYQTVPLRLSEFLAELQKVEFSDLPFDEMLWEAMSAGDELRRSWRRGDALALAAISDIVATRIGREPVPAGIDGEDATPANLERTAFIIRSLKTPDELRTLRAVYGPRLIVVAAYSPQDVRTAYLAGKIRDSRNDDDRTTWTHRPEELIARDMSEEQDGGQDVSDTFHRADFFIRGSAQADVREDVVRVLDIMFGHPYRTPTREEHAQFVAAGEARRSAELGRQVGAVIVTADGAVVALGANEVPIAGGGSYWEGDPGADNREFAHGSVETNRRHQTAMAEAVGKELSETLSSTLARHGVDVGVRAAIERELDERLPEAIRAGLKDITEYGRAVHAEMDALLDAARRGIAVEGCTVHTTTFPCHNCARHLVAAGIRRIVFVEPYDKSKASVLHEDSIVLGAADAAEKICFEPFVGVAPRRYLEYFDANARQELAGQTRKDDDGRVRTFDKRTAIPLFTDLVVPADLRPLLPAYRQREVIALGHFDLLLEAG